MVFVLVEAVTKAALAFSVVDICRGGGVVIR